MGVVSLWLCVSTFDHPNRRARKWKGAEKGSDPWRTTHTHTHTLVFLISLILLRSKPFSR